MIVTVTGIEIVDPTGDQHQIDVGDPHPQPRNGNVGEVDSIGSVIAGEAAVVVAAAAAVAAAAVAVAEEEEEEVVVRILILI